MKSTGIIRRIDELGRIVIPKEIRKNLRIKEGENLEIYIDNETIILKKYSVLKNLTDMATIYAEVVNSLFKENIIITDTDTVIAASGKYKKKLLNKNISEELLSSIQRRENLLESHKKNLKITNEELEVTYTIHTIVVGGDAVGLVLIFSEDEKIDEKIDETCLVAANFLAKYLED